VKAERPRVLVLCDDYWHPARTARAGLAALEREYEFAWIEHAGEWSPERMGDYKLVLLTKSNHVSSADRTPWVDDAAQAAFAAYVRAGNGLVVVHSGTAGYADTPLLRRIIGGVFASHPPQCTVEVRPRPGHVLCRDIQAFEIFDEHYIMELDDAADVFLSTSSAHGTQPAGWTRREGDGRVCVLTPGHNIEVWLHPSYRQLLRNALSWCAGKEPGTIRE